MILLRPFFYLKRLSVLTLKNLRVFKVRAMLTVLGIFFGIVAVIGTFTVNGNVSSMVADELKRAGTNTLVVSTGWSQKSMSYRNIDAIRKYSPAAKAVIPVVTNVYQTVSHGPNVGAFQFIGTEAGYLEIKNLLPVTGRSLHRRDVGERVAVIGANIAQNLFGSLNPVGRVIRVGMGANLITFRVVGLLPPQRSSKFLSGGDSPDDTIYVPLKALRTYLDRKKAPSLLIQAKSEEALSIARDQVVSLMTPIFGADLKVSDPREDIEKNRKMVDGMVLSGIAIGILSLISGGIGIMNIMLVSVLQRRREIGLYKALGFTDRSILLQFVAEALAISVIGSIFGILSGVPAGSILSSILLDGYSAINVPSIVIAVVFSLTVGVAFGYLPARRASSLDPIEALKG